MIREADMRTAYNELYLATKQSADGLSTAGVV